MRVGRASVTCLVSLFVFFGSTAVPLAAPLMVEKNLFAQDRKPPSNDATTSQQANKPALPPKAFQLDGIFVMGGTKKALLRVKGQLPGQEKRKGNSPYVSVREGDTVGGYEVSRIDSHSVFLLREGQTYEVRLFAEGKVAPPAAPAPPPQEAPEGAANAGRGGAQPPGLPPGQAPDGRYTGANQQPPPGLPPHVVSPPPQGEGEHPGAEIGPEEGPVGSEPSSEEDQTVEEDVDSEAQ